jgi:glycosyltransferase involved in cell wall biosynthesis
MHSKEPTMTTPAPETRVAVVVTQLTLGGAEKQTVELLRRLKGTSWEPRLVISLSGELEPYGRTVEQLGYPLVVIPRGSNFELRRVLRLRALLLRERIDLVHAVHLFASGYAWLAALLAWHRFRVLPSMRSGALRSSSLHQWFYRAMFLHTRKILVNSHSAAAVLTRECGVPLDRLVVVPNGLDFVTLRADVGSADLRLTLGVENDTPIVGFIGKDSPVKNVPLFCTIVGRLMNEIPGLHAVLVGQKLDEGARRKFAASLPPERIHFLGARSDVPRLLRDIDVLLLTSHSEGCPNVVLEALAVGTPVIAAPAGDIPLIIRAGENGSLIWSGRVEDYVVATKSWLSKGRPRVPMGALCQELERTYGIDGMVAGTLAAWKLLCSGSVRVAREL